MQSSLAVAWVPGALRAPAPPAARQHAHRRLLAARALKNTEEAAVGEAAAASAAAAAPEEGQQQPSPLASYDNADGGWEGAATPDILPGELSDEESAEQQQQEEQRRVYEAYLERLRAEGKGDLADAEAKRGMMVCMEVLESVDGMVGNYETACDLAQKRAEQQEAADDYNSILQELEALKAMASGRAGAGEGAGVQDVE